MYQPYKMVLINGIFVILVLLILFIYFKFFKKKNTNYLFILLIVSFLPVVSIFRAGTYESGDLSLHVMRTMSFYTIAFVENIFPRWTPEFNVGYGDPHFLFAYFLPYSLGSIFHFIGFSFLDSIKLLLSLSFILSGVTMYFWAKEELGEKAGFVSALFYLFAPYHLVDLHFRVTIAETLSFVFLPLLLLLTKKIIIKSTFITMTSFAVSYALLILTHQITSLIFSPILFTYGIFFWITRKKRNNKNLLNFFLSIILGLFLSAFYWIPIIVEAKYTQTNFSQVSFTPFIELLYSPWRFGFLFQGHRGELSFLIGYTQLFIIIAAIYLLVRKKLDMQRKQLLFFFLPLFFLLIFMIVPQSKFIWDITPLLKNAQYSYRLLEFVALCTSITAGIVVAKWNNNYFIIIVCAFTVVSTILNWGNRGTIPSITDPYLQKEFLSKPDVGMYLEPSSPIWADLYKSNLRKKPDKHIEILSGKAEIQELPRTSINHTYIINVKSPTTIKENTLYFPGWTLFVNEKQQRIIYTDKKYPGIILFKLNPGLYNVELKFSDTPDRVIAKFISVITLIALMLFWFYKTK